MPDPFVIDEFRLDNGLQVVVLPDAGASGTAINLWYHVGSGDEVPGATGFAHLFEHLMFSGTDEIASGEHLRTIESLGGTANASTSFDHTTYFDTVGSGAAELACWLEAQRMRGLSVTAENFRVQRDVVKEERRQRYDNVPYGDQLELLLALNFPDTHPYAHAPIGSMADLDAARVADVHEFYDAWYQPSGATLVLCGALSDPQDLAARYFGDLDTIASPARATIPSLPPHEGMPTLSVSRQVPRSLTTVAWRIPAVTHPDALALGLALDILGAGTSSRLSRSLFKRLHLVEACGAFDLGLARGSSLAVVAAHNRPDVSTQAVADATLNELERLCAGGPGDDELDRAKASAEADYLGQLSTITGRADACNAAVAQFDDPHRINTYVEHVAQIDVDDVREVAQTWLHPDHAAILKYEAQR